MIPRELLITTAILFALALGMGIYLAQLRHREALVPSVVPALSPTTSAKTGPTESITAWVAHDDSGTLRQQSIVIPASSGRQQHAQEVMRALLKIYTAKDSPHPIGQEAEIRDVFLASPGLAVVDLNAAFADKQTSGILSEELTITSIVQTLSSGIPGLTRVKFLIDGKDRDTLAGHADLSGIYDVAQISELAKQLSQ